METAVWIIALSLGLRLLVTIADYLSAIGLKAHVIRRDLSDSAEKRWRHHVETERYINSSGNVRLSIATLAMQGLLSDQRDGSAWSQWNEGQLAERAFRYADAMLAESVKQEIED